jgi:hypothetical protein
VTLLRDVLARVVRAAEALADGDQALAAAVLRELEADLAGTIARLEERRAA